MVCAQCKCSQYVCGIDSCGNVNYGEVVPHAETVSICMNCGVWADDGSSFGDYWEKIILRGYNELQRSPKRNDVEIYVSEDEYAF